MRIYTESKTGRHPYTLIYGLCSVKSKDLFNVLVKTKKFNVSILVSKITQIKKNSYRKLTST